LTRSIDSVALWRERGRVGVEDCFNWTDCAELLLLVIGIEKNSCMLQIKRKAGKKEKLKTGNDSYLLFVDIF